MKISYLIASWRILMLNWRTIWRMAWRTPDLDSEKNLLDSLILDSI